MNSIKNEADHRQPNNSPLPIGSTLKKLRNSRGLSLDALSRLTSVSKPMLAQIEKGQSAPTITTLWKIATGLKVPLSIFLEEPEADFVHATKAEDKVITAENGTMRAYPLFPFDPLQGSETFLIEFDPRCSHIALPHEQGIEEEIFVIQGILTMRVQNREVQVCPQEALRFRADVDHEYRNERDGPCIVYNTMKYPKH